MKLTCYLQLVPRRNRYGVLLGVSVKHLSQRCPGVAAEGAQLVKLELNVPDSAFKPTVVTVDVPLEKLAANVVGVVS